VEQLLTPLTRFSRQYPQKHFAIDNGAYSRFDRAAFLRLLTRETDAKRLCRFVVVPDVVASARRTLEVFHHWRSLPILHGWPLALAIQDGQESLPIPWDSIDAIFVGGSTAWKMSRYAVQIIQAARALGKWVHIGRVNSPGRFEYFAQQVGIDSIDGTGLSRYTHMRLHLWQQDMEPTLL